MLSRLKAFFLGQQPESDRIEVSKYNPSDIITRDVCVIGGGAAGTYAAVQLQRKGKSVVVVEKEARLGGQTTTYIDPDSNKPIEYGVTWFMDLPVVRDFFAQLGTRVTPSSFTYKLDYYDFRTGEQFPPISSAEDQRAALEKYHALMTAKYPFLRLGFYLPARVPEELLLPFGQFVRMHNMGSLLPSLGGLNFLGDWLRQPTIYVMKYLNMDFVTGLAQGFLKPENRNNSTVYDTALAKIGTNNVLLSHRVLAADRVADPMWTYLEVQEGTGENASKRLIRAQRIILAVPPLPTVLHGLDLSSQENDLFNQFQYTYCYTGVVKIPGLGSDICYVNRGSADPFAYPRVPNLFVLRPSDVPELFTVHFGSSTPLSEDQLKREIIGSIRSFRHITPEIRILGDHSPYQLRVPAEAIANGFYRDLNGLQGHRRTYYIGAAFESHNSPQIWELTAQILENELLPSLSK
ncbi:FAD/NAD(P)-binding domain-containing protein [Aspergillus ambiguus]|uniref:FAD/NAD(P)-binding domain-containing protein n=1 Tax=Aspergillus ambiguus TaxID=176160 RepID=UPI003CCDF284